MKKQNIQLILILLGLVVLTGLVLHSLNVFEGLENVDPGVQTCNSNEPGVTKLCGNPNTGFYACRTPQGNVLKPCGKSDPGGFGGDEVTCGECKYCGWCIKDYNGTCVAGNSEGPLDNTVKCDEYDYKGKCVFGCGRRQPSHPIRPTPSQPIQPTPSKPQPRPQPSRPTPPKPLPPAQPSRGGTPQQIVRQCLSLCGADM